MAVLQPIGPERRDPAPVHQPVFVPKKKSKAGRFIALAVAFMGSAVALAFCLRPPAVVTAPVVRGTAIQAVYATGLVEAAVRVTVRSKIAGSVAELKVHEGDHVSKGDVIAVIDSPALKYDLERGKVELWAATRQATAAPRLVAIDSQAASTRADLEVARKERDRLRDLVTSGSAASADLEHAEARVSSLDAQLRAYWAREAAERIDLTAHARGSTAQVESLTAKLEDTQVRAPMDGTILSRVVEAGDSVTADQAIVRIGDTGNLLLESSVDESDINRVSVGSPAAVSLYAFSGRALRATVKAILPDADRARKSFLVKIKLDAPPPGLRTGMTGEVNIIVDERARALLAPSESVDASGIAWIVRDGRAVRQAVRVGIRDMLKVEILEGVVEGDQVVVSGVDSLCDHCRVLATVREVREAREPAAPAPSAPPAASAASAPPAPERPEAIEPPPSSSMAAAVAAPEAPKANPIPPKMGIIVPPTSARGHRILVDNMWAGDGAEPIRWSCGLHNVAIGSRSTPRRVVVPCGGTVTLEEKL